MNNLDIGFYVSIAIRRLPLILAIALIVLLGTVIGVRHLPLAYSASAKILAEEPQIPTELARSTVPTGAMTQLLILQQQITTREALVALADKMDIYRDSPVKPAEEDIVGDLTGRIRFDQLQLDPKATDQGVIVFAVSFKAQNPTLAANVANELARMILATSQRERTDRAGNTLEFFNQKVAGLDAELNRVDTAILKFKTENKDTLPESLSFRRNQQDSLQGRLASLENEEADLRTRRNALIANYAGTGQLSDAVALSPEQQMLADLNRALAEQLAMFTEDSPNIKTIRARIDALRKSIVVLPPTAAGKKDAKDGKQKVTFGLDLQLTDVNERLQAIAQEKRDVAQRIDDLTRSIAETPASEMALNALLRTHENLQTQYKTAIAQRAEASTGQQIETRSDGQRFSLLEEATPPTKAAGPKRKLLILGGALAGLGIGAALVVLLEILNRKVRRPKDLAKLQIEPLGTIPVIRTRREVRAANMKLGFAAFLSAGVPACLAAVHYYYMPLDLVVQKIISGIAWIGLA